MDPETLVTFAFRAPQDVRRVELLGSWDNFSRPYAMFHDRRRGHGFWTGCFEFQNIIFDGSQVDYTRPRNGGLKQGGTYWYYFRLDDGVEAYDDLRECTADCPLMPGQVVNVIDVPREIVEPQKMQRSMSVDLVGTLAQQSSLQTMDPKAKFQALDPPPVSKVHERCISDFALGGRLEGRPLTPPKEESPWPLVSEEPQIKSPTKKMFGTIGSLQRRGMSLTGSLRSMAGRAAMRARVRHEATTYEASLIDEAAERASIHPARSSGHDTSRPPTRRPLADVTISPTNVNDNSTGAFQTFSQVIAIPTPSASPTKPSRSPSHAADADAASIGPQSIRNIQFLSSSPDQRPRLYSLHDPDRHCHALNQSENDHQQRQHQNQHPSPALGLASPTFSDATVSTAAGDELATATPAGVEDEVAARWGRAMREYECEAYRLPEAEDPVWTPKAAAGGGAGVAEAIFSELGYLGGSIQ